MPIVIDNLPAAANAQPDHVLPAMRNGETVKLTAQQLAIFITALITDSAPSTLDTLNELAAALGDDPNFATTITAALAAKASLTGAETLTNKTLTAPIVNDAMSGEFLRGYVRGLTISNNTADATNDIDIAAGQAASDGTTPVLMTLASGITKRLDASWSVGSGNGGLDTGSIANGWYYVWLIRRPDTGVVDVLFSASATAPTMPANYTQKMLLWPFWRDAGTIRPFTQRNNDFTWVSPVENFNSINVSTTGALVTVTAPPVNGVEAKLRIVLSEVGTRSAWVRDTTQVNDAPTPLGNSDVGTLSSSARSYLMKRVFVNASSQVRYRCDTATVGAFILTTEGFVFPRGGA